MARDRPFAVMTVCTGNICRSPMVEAVLRQRLDDAGLGDRVVVASRGVSGEEEGNPIDPRAARVLRDAGYAVPDHVAHRVTAAELQDTDLVLAATARHAARLRALDGSDADRVRMLRSFDPRLEGVHEAQQDLPDPWYGDTGDFRRTLAAIEASADGVVAEIRRRL